MVIFSRTFDFLTWLLSVTNHFPRAYRHTWTRRLLAVYRSHEIALEQLDASVQGWINHVRYGNTVGLRKAVFRDVFSTRKRPSP